MSSNQPLAYRRRPRGRRRFFDTLTTSMSAAGEREAGSDAPARRHAEVQYAVSRALGRARNVDEALDALLPSVTQALGWHYSAAWLADFDNEMLQCTHVWTTGEPELVPFVRASRSRRAMRGAGLVGRVWAGGRPLWLSDALRLPDFRRAALARSAGFVDGIAFPVQRSTGVGAVIECFTRVAEPPDYGLLRLSEALGHQVGLFLDRRAAEEHLEENEARYAAIVHGALDAIVVIDEQGMITEFNPAAERLFGWRRPDVIGLEMASVIIPRDLRPEHRAGLLRHRASAESRILERRIELTALKSDGTEFPVELTISRFTSHARSAFIGFLRDITDRQRYEQERESLLRAERAARLEATTANGLKDEFLAALSHEMRTPLNAVLGWTHMLITGTVAPERVTPVLGTIFRNAEAQKRIVDDLLDISAFVAGQMRMECARLNLADVVQVAAEALRPDADARGVALTASLCPAWVSGDRMRLQQVVWNLLSNAMKFTATGGRISVDLTVDAGMSTVVVRDTGSGIDPEFLPFVFDRFRQGAGVHSASGGLGLGLAIVQQIISAHHGSVSAASAGPGCGAAFTVTLPLTEA
jgi:PAS domain S-box-containing protein